MKKTFFLRHAKSEWGSPQLPDFDRPLNERGRVAAPQMAAYFAAKKYAVDVVYCSTARRTRETLDFFLAALGASVRVQYEDSLYLAEPARILGFIRGLDASVGSVMFIGHNPGLEQIVLELAAAPQDPGAEKLHRKVREKFSTCSLAYIAFDTDSWARVTRQSGRLVDFKRPRDL